MALPPTTNPKFWNTFTDKQTYHIYRITTNDKYYFIKILKMASEFVKTEFIDESQNLIKVEASEIIYEDEPYDDYMNELPQSNFRYDF